MRRALIGLTWLGLLLCGAAALFVALATDDRPSIERGEAISPEAIGQARLLFRAYDPRKQPPGKIQHIAVPAALLDEGTNYVANRYLRGRGALVLRDNAAEIRLSIRLPGQRYLNLTALAAQHDGRPRLLAFSAGQVPLPTALAEWAVVHAITLLGLEREWQMAGQALQDVVVDVPGQRLVITYVWDPALLDRARSSAVAEADVAHLRAARQSLAALLAHRAPGSQITLDEVLVPLLRESGDDTRRGRAVLLVLASELAHKDLGELVPAARAWPRVRWVFITLAGRHDLAQHFVISAALAAWAGEPVADAIGLYKEIEDSRRGSGFSFVDLAADRAGTRLGELLVRQPSMLTERLRQNPRLLPDHDDLPEGLPEAEFLRRFDGPGSPRYQALADAIEQRLDALPLYRPQD